MRITTGGLQVFAGLSYDLADRALLIYPNPGDLRSGLEYVLSVGSAVRGWDGSQLRAPVVVRFRPTVREAVAAAPRPSLRMRVAPLLAARCASSAACHGATDPAMGLDLSSPESVMRTAVGVMAREGGGAVFLESLDPRWAALPRVDPGFVTGQGRPEFSYLAYKLLGDGPIWGARMPPNGAPLAGEDLRAVLDWITAGALDD